MAAPQAKSAQTQQKPKGGSLRVIRNVYLYLVSIVGLVTFIFGSVGIINNVLQHYVFQVDSSSYYAAPIYPGNRDQCNSAYNDPTDPENKRMLVPTTQETADCRAAQAVQDKKVNDSNFFRELSIAIAQIVIGLPLWLYHWAVIQKEYRKHEDNHEI